MRYNGPDSLDLIARPIALKRAINVGLDGTTAATGNPNATVTQSLTNLLPAPNNSNERKRGRDADSEEKETKRPRMATRSAKKETSGQAKGKGKRGGR